jgi:uncharacterized protein with GYD domain
VFLILKRLQLQEGGVPTKRDFKELGAEMKEFYTHALLCEYDTLFIAEAPNDETIAKAAMSVASLGNATRKHCERLRRRNFARS